MNCNVPYLISHIPSPPLYRGEVNSDVMSKVHCVLCCTTEGRGREKRGSANSKTKQTKPLISELIHPWALYMFQVYSLVHIRGQDCAFTRRLRWFNKSSFRWLHRIAMAPERARQSITNTRTRTNFPNWASLTPPLCGFSSLPLFAVTGGSGYKCDLAV